MQAPFQETLLRVFAKLKKYHQEKVIRMLKINISSVSFHLIRGIGFIDAYKLRSYIVNMLAGFILKSVEYTSH